MNITVKTRLILDLLSSFYIVENKWLKFKSYLGYLSLKVINSPSLKKYMAQNPSNAYLLLTTRCNMTCHDCCFLDILNKKDLGKMDFDLDQIKELFQQDAFKSVSRTALFGGEATLCKALIDIILFFRQKGIVVNLISNALKIDETALQTYRDSDVNLLGLTIYEKSENGMKYNLDKLEAIFDAAYLGAFDPMRIQLYYHSTTIEGYEFAYEFAKKLKAKHLKFNTTFYSDTFPLNSGYQHCENSSFIQKYNDLCESIERDGVLNLERPRGRSSNSDNGKSSLAECRYTTNGMSIGPTNALSPCCFLSPDKKYGTIENPSPLFDFKNQFISGEVPKECDGCIMLGQEDY